MKDKILQLAIFLAVVGICFSFINRYSFIYIDAPGIGKNVPFFLYAFFGALVGYACLVFFIRNKFICQTCIAIVLLCIVADVAALIFIIQKLNSLSITSTFIIGFHSVYCTFALVGMVYLTMDATAEFDGHEFDQQLRAVCKCGRKSAFAYEQAGTKTKCSCGRILKLPTAEEIAQATASS